MSRGSSLMWFQTSSSGQLEITITFAWSHFTPAHLLIHRSKTAIFIVIFVSVSKFSSLPTHELAPLVSSWPQHCKICFYLFILNFTYVCSQIQPYPLPSNSFQILSSISPYQPPIMFSNQLSPISTGNIHVSLRFTGTWAICQGPHPWRKLPLTPQYWSMVNSSSVEGGTLWRLPSSMPNYYLVGAYVI